MTAKLYNTTWAYDSMIDNYTYLDESSFDLGQGDTEHENTVKECEIWKQLYSTFLPALKSVYFNKFGEDWENTDVYLDFLMVDNKTLLIGVRNWGSPSDENTYFEIKPDKKYSPSGFELIETGNKEALVSVISDGPVKMNKEYFETNFSIQERLEHVVEYFQLNFNNIAIGDYTGDPCDTYYDGADSDFLLFDMRNGADEVIDFPTFDGSYDLLEYIYEQFGIDYRLQDKK